MNTLNLANNKVDGESTLAASEWNTLVTGVNTLITEVNNLPTPSGESDPVVIEGDSHVSFNDSKKNLTIETTETRVDGKGGHINIEPVGDFQIKPAGTEKKYTHHRDEDHLREYKVAVLNGANINKEKDYPVDLKVQAANLELNTEDKQNYIDHVNVDRQAAGKGNTSDDDDIFNIEVTTGVKKDDATRQNPHFGYLKVRARAIDLRCEDHGGIALQPRGEDGQHHMNKIKFEHGGGDGLEFGTFNTEKTSIFTDEYRFNREGVWKMATREKEVSDNYDVNDETTHYKYTKQADDFYDVITPYNPSTDTGDVQCKTKDIIKTAYAMNGGKDRHAKITKKGALEIATNVTWTLHITEDNGSAININTISDEIAALSSVSDNTVYNEGNFKVGDNSFTPNTSAVYTNGTQFFSFTEVAAPSIKIESGAELKLGGILDFGSSFNFGETDNGIEVQYKLTKKNATKDCGKLRVVAVNNHASNNIVIDQSKWVLSDPSDPTSALVLDTSNTTVAPGNTEVVAEASIYDIIKLTNYMKSQGQGPWANNL